MNLAISIILLCIAMILQGINNVMIEKEFNKLRIESELNKQEIVINTTHTNALARAVIAMRADENQIKHDIETISYQTDVLTDTIRGLK